MTKEWHDYCNNQSVVDAALQAFRDMGEDPRDMQLFRHYQFELWQTYKNLRRVAA